jgi:excisionase family DNA binding protein
MRAFRVEPASGALNRRMHVCRSTAAVMLDQLSATSLDGPFLTARAVAHRLGVGTETVLRWTRCGQLPGFRLPGGALRYRPTEVDAWLAQRATSGIADPDIPAKVRPPGELSRIHRANRRGDDQDARDAARPGVQAQLW